mgnify:CR=1 FL=1
MWENILKILQRYGDVYLEGLAGTLWIAALTVVAGTVIGIILAVFRLGKCRPCEWFVRFYIWIIRGTPSLLQLYFFYLFLPKVLPIEISETESVVIALIISAGAYVSEIIRAGIQAVDPGQTEAASCLGLSRAQTLRFIILPQAVKNILPAIGNEFVTMVKETSIIQYLGISDLMYNNGIVITATYNPLPCYYISALIYLTLNICLGKGLNIFEGRMKKSER